MTLSRNPGQPRELRARQAQWTSLNVCLRLCVCIHMCKWHREKWRKIKTNSTFCDRGGCCDAGGRNCACSYERIAACAQVYDVMLKTKYLLCISLLHGYCTDTTHNHPVSSLGRPVEVVMVVVIVVAMVVVVTVVVVVVGATNSGNRVCHLKSGVDIVLCSVTFKL